MLESKAWPIALEAHKKKSTHTDPNNNNGESSDKKACFDTIQQLHMNDFEFPQVQFDRSIIHNHYSWLKDELSLRPIEKRIRQSFWLNGMSLINARKTETPDGGEKLLSFCTFELLSFERLGVKATRENLGGEQQEK